MREKQSFMLIFYILTILGIFRLRRTGPWWPGLGIVLPGIPIYYGITKSKAPVPIADSVD